MALRLTYLVIGSSLLTYTTTPNKLTDAIEALLKPLEKIKVPVHDIAMMMSLALRFIPILLEEANRIIRAQSARGADFEEGKLIERLKGMVSILVPLLVSATKRAYDLALAMEARCYRGGEGRTKMKPPKYRKADGLAMGIVVLYIIILLIVRHFFCKRSGMMRVRLVVAYDGTNYHGWQIQNNAISVEEVLQEALRELLREPVELIGASRTDAGVHAQGNVAVFDTDTRIPAEKIAIAVNQRLPEDIRVMKSEQVEETFHPRYAVSEKTYEYRISNVPIQLPTERLYSYFVYLPLDIEKMHKAAQLFIGEHDFAGFLLGKKVRCRRRCGQFTGVRSKNGTSDLYPCDRKRIFCITWCGSLRGHLWKWDLADGKFLRSKRR